VTQQPFHCGKRDEPVQIQPLRKPGFTASDVGFDRGGVELLEIAVVVRSAARVFFQGRVNVLEKDMNLAMAQPWCSIGSDGSAYATKGLLRRGNPHPRNFGTFPRVLGVYVRERGLLRLEDAVRKMTSLNAAKLGLRNRGLFQTGAFADIVIFDPARVMDRSTYEEPFQ
jgi:N-acyl-D-aspartate/D-glutamate deacylase